MTTTWLNDYLVNTTTSGYQQAPDTLALTDGRYVVVWNDASATGGDTSGFAIRGQIYNGDGSASGSEFVVNTTTAGNQTNAAMTALPGGGFVVTWTDASASGSDTSGNAIRAQMFDASGAKTGGEFLVNTTVAASQEAPSVTTLPDGGFFVVWTDYSATGGDTSGSAIRGQRFDSSGTMVGSEVLINTTTGANQTEPIVTVLQDGTLAVAWTDASQTGGDTSNTAIRGQIMTVGGTLVGPEVVINTTTTGEQSQPAGTVLSDGRLVVVWADRSQSGGDTNDLAVRGQIFNADGTPAGSEFLVNTTTTYGQYEPEVVAFADGGFLIVFNDGSGSSHSDVRAQAYNADGTKSGSEFLLHVNNGSGWDEGQGTLSRLPDGRIVAAWFYGNNTGEDRNVRAKILDPRQGPVSLTGTADGDQFYGTNYDDAMSGRAGSDRLVGEGGNDRLDGGAGADTMIGGKGSDSYVVDDAGDVVTETDGTDAGGTDSVRASVTYTLGDFVESLALAGSGNIDGTGNALGNAIAGNAGNNVLTGLAGADSLRGGGGADTLSGGDGDDSLDGGTGADSMSGDGGSDIYVVDNAGDAAVETDATDAGGTDLVRASVTYTIGDNIEKLTLTGSGNIDGTGNSLANTIMGNAGNNVLSGLSGNDVMLGGAGSDTLNGGSGDDRLDGGTGADSLVGGSGNDTYTVDNAGDSVLETAGGDDGGLDLVRASLTFTLGDNLEKLTLTGSGNIDGTGNSLANTMIGNSGNNVLSGAAGTDTINGGTGDDTLIGGADRDILTGGAGNDTFAFAALGDSGTGSLIRDTIADFAGTNDLGGDTIDLSDLAVAEGVTLTYYDDGAFHGGLGDVRSYQTAGGNTYVEIDIDGNNGADFQVLVRGLHDLDAGDFVL